MHSCLQHLTAPPKEWPLPCPGALLTLTQSSSFQRGIGAIAGLSVEPSPLSALPALCRWVAESASAAPTRAHNRKGGVRVRRAADSDAIKEAWMWRVEKKEGHSLTWGDKRQGSEVKRVAQRRECWCRNYIEKNQVMFASVIFAV